MEYLRFILTEVANHEHCHKVKVHWQDFAVKHINYFFIKKL